MGACGAAAEHHQLCRPVFLQPSASNCALNDNAASLWNRARFYDCTLCKDSYYQVRCIDVPTSTVYDGNELRGYANRLSSHFF